MAIVQLTFDNRKIHDHVRKRIPIYFPDPECPECGFRNCHCRDYRTNIAIYYGMSRHYWENRIN